MAFLTYSIGRATDSDLRVVHASVSRQHAELTVTSEGRYYLTDRGSSHGTWTFRDGKWKEHRQGYVDRNDRLRLGRHVIRLGELLKGRSLEIGASQPSYEPVSVRPRRNLGTGEVEV